MTPSPNEHPAPATTHALPDCLSKLVAVCIASSGSLRLNVKLPEIRERDQVRLTIAALELLRQAHAAVGKLLVDVADLYQTFSDVVLPNEQPAQQATAELQPSADKQPPVSWFPLRPLLVCPHCGAVALALESSGPFVRFKMTRELSRLQKLSTRALFRPRLRRNVVASLRALDPAKIPPETLQLLLRLRSRLGHLLVDVNNWFQPINNVLDAATKLNDDPSELPAFVIGVEGLVDVQRREPCEHLVAFSCLWSANVRRQSSLHPAGWRRPANPDAVNDDPVQLQGRKFFIDGNNKQVYPLGFGARGEAWFTEEAAGQPR